MSILLFYIRLFGVRNAFRYSVFAMMAVTWAWGISVFFATLFRTYFSEMTFPAWYRPESSDMFQEQKDLSTPQTYLATPFPTATNQLLTPKSA